MKLLQTIGFFVLPLSLLFNVFFAVGYMQAKQQAEATTDESVTETVSNDVAEMLQLDDSQREVYRSLRQRHSREAAVFDEEFRVARRNLVEAIGRDQPDIEEIRTALHQVGDAETKRRRAATGAFNEFLGVLTPQQCHRLREKIGGRGINGERGERGRRGRGRGDGRPIPAELRAEYDANGDGELDETERAALMAYIEKQQRDREQRYVEAAARFDADGDGKLNEDEHEAFRAWMYEQRRGHRRGGERGDRGDRGDRSDRGSRGGDRDDV